ncbi:MAG: glycoside hydrolase family 65 protein [Deltaproteobacteria bacterium]|nr:glycoside hydrolase family 65 protein [Deltaproteobacteria bacterium]
MNQWTLVYEGFDPQQEGLREALCTLGNGYFATRGAGPEAAADNIHYPGTYLSGGYNRLKTEIAGKSIENEDLVNMPNWLPLNFRIGSRNWFNLMAVDLISYRQELDLKEGILRRRFRFRDSQGRQTQVTCRRLVHMQNPHYGAQELTLTAENWSGPVEFCTALDGRVINAGVERYKQLNNNHLEPLATRMIDAEAIYLEVQTNQSKLRVSQAARTRVYQDGQLLEIERKLIEKPRYIAQHFNLDLKEGREVLIEKAMAMYTSRDRGISECGLAAQEALQRCVSFAALRESHTLAWEQLWRRFEIEFQSNDVSETDDEYITMVLHLYIFHLLQTTSMHTMDLDVGVPSRGWHGEAYRGHIFWDELFVFPFLNLRLHEITRALLQYRFRRLNEARFNARQYGYRGALYPWQSGSSGREESQKIHLNPRSRRWIPDNTYLQFHVNSAIAYNVYHYFQVTRDLEFLAFFGAEMMLEIARFWGSIATYNPSLERYEILGVMGPDEYHDRYPDREEPGLDNNAYTNLMAVWVLSRTLELFDLLPEDRSLELCKSLELQKAEMERWRDISHKMFVPFHDDGIISQFQGYEQLAEFDWDGYRKKYGDIQRLDRILEAEGDTPNRYKVSKQADVLMLFYLFSSEQLRELFEQLGYPFAYETIPKNIDYYLKRTSHGSTLSRVAHSWVLVRSDRAGSWQLFNQALASDIADIQGGTTPEGIHLGAMAGVVDLMQRAYTGVETRGNVLLFNPFLPKELGKLHLRIRYRCHSLEITLTPDKLRIEALEFPAGPIRIGVRGNVFELKRGETIEVSLA